MDNNFRNKEKKLLLFYTSVLIILLICYLLLRVSIYNRFFLSGLIILLWICYFNKELDNNIRAYSYTIISMLVTLSYYFMDWNIIEIPIFAYTIYLPAMLAVSFLERMDLIKITGIYNAVLLVLDFVINFDYYTKSKVAFISYLYSDFTVLMSMFLISYIIGLKIEGDKKLIKANEELLSEKQNKENFVANVSHELRTPLNSLNSLLQQLKYVNISSEIKQDYEDAIASEKRMESLITDVLTYFGFSAGKIVPDKKEYNFSSVILECVNGTIVYNEKKHLEIVVNCSPSIPAGLIGDNTIITKIIENIVVNAVKYTEKGGVYITVRDRKETYGVNLVITVEDSGIGMEPELIDRVMKSGYVQADSSSIRKGEGLGIGIALTKLLLSSMNGFMHIDSIPGRGTKVTMVIPQGVSNEAHMAHVENPESKRVAFYNKPESFNNNSHSRMYRMVLDAIQESDGISIKNYDTMDELESAVERGGVSHVIITSKGYVQNWNRIDEFPKSVMVFIIQNTYEEQPFELKSNYRVLYKPFFTMGIINLLNGNDQDNDSIKGDILHLFKAPLAKILAVDDNAMNLRILENFLKPYETKLFTALNGKDAIEIVKRDEFDLIFLDYMMPEMDGIECLKIIRGLGVNNSASVPIIALTANTAPGAMKMFIDNGFDSYIAKPINIAALESGLKNFLPKNLIVDALQGDGNTPKQGDVFILEHDNANTSGQGSVNTPKQGNVGILEQGDPYTSGQGNVAEGERAATLIDKSVGLSYSCDSMELYRELVKVYFEDAPDNINRMEELFSAGDYKEYTVLTHALKSNSLQIGAEGLSREAKAMEKAGKSGDFDFIVNNHSDLIRHYKEVLDEIAGWEV